MSYEVALNKSWDEVTQLVSSGTPDVVFFGDNYSVDIKNRKILSLSCNIAAKDFVSIIILHYLAKKLKGLPKQADEWLTFRELSGVEGYSEAYHKRSIEPIIRKYGKNPEAIKGVLERLPAKLFSGGDFGIIVQAFEAVPVLIKLWAADEEFAADANMYFDASIKDIFCIEDIVVLAQMVASRL